MKTKKEKLPLVDFDVVACRKARKKKAQETLAKTHRFLGYPGQVSPRFMWTCTVVPFFMPVNLPACWGYIVVSSVLKDAAIVVVAFLL